MKGEIKNKFSLYQSRLMLQILIKIEKIQQKREPRSFGGELLENRPMSHGLCYESSKFNMKD